MSSTAPTSVSTLYAIPTITSYINVGPMTTAINFPANCRNDVYDFGESGIGLPYSYYTQGCALSSCCPSNHVYSSAFEWYSYYYSPAVCPFGYTQGPVDPIISTASGENARWCCPTCASLVDRNSTEFSADADFAEISSLLRQTRIPLPQPPRISTGFVSDNITIYPAPLTYMTIFSISVSSRPKP